MPRRNNRKEKPYVYEPSRFDPGFKPACYGCAFAGAEFKCTTSDGKCLKSILEQRRTAIPNDNSVPLL